MTSVNPEGKTLKIEARYHNTKQKINLSKIKRPRKCIVISQYNPSVNPVTGPSCSSKAPPQNQLK